MTRTGGGELRALEDGYAYEEGEIVCRFTANERLNSIMDMSRSSRYGEGVPSVQTPERAIEIAEDALDSTAFRFDGPITTRPVAPWDDAQPFVSVISEPEAYGYPTHGFAGRIEVQINRFTESIVAVSLLTERTPDPPNIMVTESEAEQLAEQVWSQTSYGQRASRMELGLQYYAATGEDATPAGRAYSEQGRVRMCWVAKYWQDVVDRRTGRTLSRGLASVAIDAETGEVLYRPVD